MNQHRTVRTANALYEERCALFKHMHDGNRLIQTALHDVCLPSAPISYVVEIR